MEQSTATVPPQTRQVVKAFLQDRAFAFVTLKQAVPCSRKSRRKAARDIAKRYLKRIRQEGETING